MTVTRDEQKRDVVSDVRSKHMRHMTCFFVDDRVRSTKNT